MKVNWIFKGFFAYLLWGPFVESEHRLEFFGETELEDSDKVKDKTRSNKRKNKLDDKLNDHTSDNSNKRGLTNDQLINLSHLQLQKETLLHKMNERNMIAIKIEFDSLTKEIESAERRAKRRCSEYDECNQYWKIVDGLIEERQSLRQRMKNTDSVKITEITTPCDEIMLESVTTKSSNSLIDKSIIIHDDNNLQNMTMELTSEKHASETCNTITTLDFNDDN